MIAHHRRQPAGEPAAHHSAHRARRRDGALDAAPRAARCAARSVDTRRSIVYSRWDRGPQLVGDQVTYPIVSALLGAPRASGRARPVRLYGYCTSTSFEDGTDLWAPLARPLEHLSHPPTLPTACAPRSVHATSVGWVYQYALRDRSGRQDLANLRAPGPFPAAFSAQSVPVSPRLAAVGGFVEQYQVDVDPTLLPARDVPADARARRRPARQRRSRRQIARGRGNRKVGGCADAAGSRRRTTWARSSSAPTPGERADPASPGRARDARRGHAARRRQMPDARGDTVGGVIVMRHGERARGDRARTREDRRGRARPARLVEIVPVYDRAPPRRDAIATLARAWSGRWRSSAASSVPPGTCRRRSCRSSPFRWRSCCRSCRCGRSVSR